MLKTDWGGHLSAYSSTCDVQPSLNPSGLKVQVACYEREDHFHTFFMAIDPILISSKMLIFETGLLAILISVDLQV